jgi:hypothetical protein
MVTAQNGHVALAIRRNVGASSSMLLTL